MSVFHLKYRPQKLADLDLEEVSEKLSKMLSGQNLPQSLLFAGPKGAGKTSAARILARAINCLDPQGVEPCGKCVNCQSILGGNNIDILEMDAASNRGIEDVRELKDKAYLMPSFLKRKVFIIDEVHMLTKEAFNALLKLLEEPPAHTVFIMCTTDPQKIPETVLSRLTRIEFKKGNKTQLRKSLHKIIKGEGLEISEETIDLIIKNSDGSFRNVQKLFNDIYLECGTSINQEKVDEFFDKRQGGYTETEFESDLAEGEAKIILEKLEAMAKIGVDFAEFRERLMVYFQHKLLSFYGVGEERESKLTQEETVRFLNLLILAGKNAKEVEIEQLPLELAVVEFCGQSNGVPSAGIKGGEASGQKKRKIKPAITKEKVAAEDVKIVIEDKGGVDFDVIERDWGKLLMAVKPYNHSIEAFLRATRPIQIQGRNLIVEVYYPFHKDRLEEARNRKIVEEGFKRAFGVEMVLECILAKDKKEALVINNDTPMAEVSPVLADEAGAGQNKDIYDVAKEIFG